MPGADPYKKKAGLYAVLMVLLLGLVLYAGWVSSQPRDPYARYRHMLQYQEKLAFYEVTSSNQRITLTVTGLVGIGNFNNITINGALIKNATGALVQSVGMHSNPAVIVAENVTITIHLDLTTPLTSQQQYTVTLATKAGSAFVSPLFTVP